FRCVLPEAVLANRTDPVDEGIGPAVMVPHPTMAQPAISLSNVAITYRVRQGIFGPKRLLTALRNITVELASGAALGVVGESGSGKSTLAKAILGLERPQAGTVRLFGREVHTFGRVELARAIQPVFQNPYSSLNPRR